MIRSNQFSNPLPLFIVHLHFNNMFLSAFAGWILIGISALLLSGGIGRVMGVSGIIKWILPKVEPGSIWRYMFLIGIILWAWLYRIVFPEKNIELTSDSYTLYALTGMIVGIGVSLANGCTSGHAVCGIGRLSIRSIIATLSFLTTGIITVYITHHIL